MFTSINPATGVKIAEYPQQSDAEVSRKRATALAAFKVWRQSDFKTRADALNRVANVLRQRQQAFAELMADEMGKPIKQGAAEIEKCAWNCEHYAQHAAEYLAPRNIAADAQQSFVRYDPLGPVLAIMPWNFPFWQVFRFAAPAIMAGNVALLKHAANVPGCAVAIESVFRDASVPEGVFTTLLITSQQANELIAHPFIAAVTLTGSEQAGVAVAKTAGANLKKCVLELGGSDPFLVLADADLDQVATQAVRARCQNAGQSCIAAKRFIVAESIADAFCERFAAKLMQQKLGDPRDPATEIGPLAREDLRTSLHEQVARSMAAGAKLLAGGCIPAGQGYFYPPTLLDHVTPNMPAFAEETFGPVAAVVRARDVDHAIQLANDSLYGLGASIWTRDGQQALELAPRLDAGCVFVNEMVKSDPRLPFGGVKRSGYGRELGDYGIQEFVNIKTVWVGK